jgi:hypothetical protein
MSGQNLMAKRKSKKRSTITKAVAMDRIDKMLPMVLENVQLAMKLHATLETGNDVIGDMRKSGTGAPHWYGANCYNTIRLSITLTLALTLAKLFDLGTRSRKPNERDVASIPLLLRLTKQRRCRKVLVALARDWGPDSSFAASNEATVLHQLDAASAAYAALKKKYKSRKAATTLKMFRDKKLAHSLINATLDSLPRYEDLSYLLDVSMAIGSHLRLAIKGENWTASDFHEEAQRQGKAFWLPAIEGVIDSEQRRS